MTLPLFSEITLKMNRFILFLIATIATLLFCSTTVSAQDIPDDDGEEIIIVIDDSSQGNGHGRSISSVPFNVVFYRTQSYIEVSFIDSSCGDVAISLSNMTTGSNTEMNIDSGSGNTVVPVLMGNGIYIIKLMTSDGVSYLGFFGVV